MCRRRIPIGVSLDEDILDTMPFEERAFWISFLEQARQEAHDAENLGHIRPFRPSLSLLISYRRAIGDYDGARYCQVRQLAKIFNFYSVH